MTSEVDPRPFIRETDNIMAVELFPNGDNPPLIFYTHMGRRHLVEVKVIDVTADPFYRKDGLATRLRTRRQSQGQD